MSKNIEELKKEYKDGRSVASVVEEKIEIIEKENGFLNAFLTYTFDEAKKRAMELDKLILDDKSIIDKLPLFGVPIAHKDMFMTKGVRTTAASKLLEDYIPPYSATVVELMEKAGSVMLGKLNQDAWAHGASGENSDFGPTKNPVDKEYVAGGSSSGSATAVAASMVNISSGTDTGGSIRLPASFCGVYGYKPTYGRVSRYGVVAMASSLDSIGHFGNSVKDIATVLSVTAGEDKKDATSRGMEKFNLEKFEDKRRFRVGIPKEYLEPVKNAEVKKGFESLVSKLQKNGIELVEVSLPNTEHAISVYYIIQPAEVSSNLARYTGVRYGKERDAFGSEAKRRIMMGTFILSSGYQDAFYKNALKVRTLVNNDFEEVFKKVDALIAPVSPTPAFKLGEKVDDPLEMYLQDVLTVPVNLAGLPALAIPYLKTQNHLPLGFQVIGKQRDDEGVLNLSLQIEEIINE